MKIVKGTFTKQEWYMNNLEVLHTVFWYGEVVLIDFFYSFYAILKSVSAWIASREWYGCCVQVWVICPASDRKINVKHLINKTAHKPIALRFWVRVWRLSRLCDCSSLDVDGPPSSQSDPTTVWLKVVGFWLLI